MLKAGWGLRGGLKGNNQQRRHESLSSRNKNTTKQLQEFRIQYWHRCSSVNIACCLIPLLMCGSQSQAKRILPGNLFPQFSQPANIKTAVWNSATHNSYLTESTSSSECKDIPNDVGITRDKLNKLYSFTRYYDSWEMKDKETWIKERLKQSFGVILSEPAAYSEWVEMGSGMFKARWEWLVQCLVQNLLIRDCFTVNYYYYNLLL